MLTSEMLGKKIKNLRESKKISQQLMVERLKEVDIAISRETLSKIENGNRSISAIELKGFCSVLGVDVEALLGNEEEENLVTLFRRKNVGEGTLKNIEYLQDMIISFMNQKKILKGEIAQKTTTPLWKE